MSARDPLSAPRLLAIDTSAQQVLVAVTHGTRRWSKLAPGGAASSGSLLPAIAEVLAQAEIGLPHLDAVAFCAGPGAFTGVRTGAAVAQGLALAHQLPVLPLDVLAMLAMPDDAPSTDDAIGVVIDARMNEVYFAAYRAASGQAVVAATEPQPHAAWAALQVLLPPTVGPAALAAQAFGALGVAGLRIAGQAEWMAPHMQTGWTAVPTAIDAGRLLDAATLAWRLGQAVAAHEAQPVYVRNKVALTTAERAARAASGEAA